MQEDELKVKIEADDRYFHPRASLMGSLDMHLGVMITDIFSKTRCDILCMNKVGA